jgi:hypothetical protein
MIAAATPHFTELLYVLTPAVVVPLGVFCGNWALRYRLNYNQTAAPDFLLAVLIFDGAVISATKDFQPFVRDPHFGAVAQQFHIIFGFLTAAAWFQITNFAEPVLAEYYKLERRYARKGSFKWTLIWSWALVLGLVAAHIAFFFKGSGHG